MELTEATFQSEVMESNTPVLVDFWATWCPPCRALVPVLESLQAEFGDTAKICKVDIEQCPALATKFNVHSIPHLLLVKDGIVQDQFIGVQSEQTLRDKIKALV